MLVVEDDPASIKLLRILLARDDTEITLATSAEEAMEILRSQCFDLIFCDLCLPRGDGIALAEYVRGMSHARRVTLVGTSGFTEEILTDLLRDSGFDGFIQKPINQATLAAQLFEIHDGKRAVQRNSQRLSEPNA